MQRNTPNANRSHRRFLDMAMSRPNLELVETARDRITIVADFPQLSPALLFDPMPNGGTKLTLLHEGYSKNSEAKKTRDEHIEGWTFFLRKLQEQGQEPKSLPS